ncbi:MAG: hypothetical protein WDO70_00215 [Alphaproteobacteria bacterium]
MKRTILPSVPSSIYRALLRETDLFARDNVIAGRGGPFGASLALYHHKTGKVERIGVLAANAVLATGVASAHAENEVLSPLQHRRA